MATFTIDLLTNKKYLFNGNFASSGGTLKNYLPLSGGTITGDLLFDQKINLGGSGYTNPSPTEGDFWWNGDGVFIRSGTTSINLIAPKGPLKSAQVRQSTQVNNIPTSWTDFSWDSTDIENDSDVIEHDNVNTDRILIKETGLYFIAYQFQIDDEAEARVRINDTTIINGSWAISNSISTSLPVMKSFLVNLNAGNFITLQTLGLALGQDVDAGANMIIVRFDGLKGDIGNDGPIGRGMLANAKTLANGTIEDEYILSVNKSGTGVYDYTFDIPFNANTYGVFAQPYNSIINTNAMVSGVTKSGFTIIIGVGDNGTVPDIPTDIEHSVIVFGSPVIVTGHTSNATDDKLQLVDSVGGQSLDNISATPLTWSQQDFYDTNTFTHTIGVHQ